MTTKTVEREKIEIDLPVIDNDFIEETFERVTGAPILAGNKVRLLIDAAENYPAWLEAIESATDRIYFESYIIHEDEQGHLFADALIKKAKEGVDVKLIYDWMGGFGKTSRSYWNRLRDNGIEVRCYNPPRMRDPLGVLSRDHRKCLIVDGSVAFVAGLCVGSDWVGNPANNIAPWRDTGVQLNGPAVADVEAAFAEVWATMGAPVEPGRISRREDISKAGDINLRVVQTAPARAHIYRVEHLLAATAQETWWLTDAYFVGIPSYLQSLMDASRDGVDVRILVPQSTDIAIIRDTTRSTYRPLLEAGVRVFEWNGPMVHAKTAVFDGYFSRVGSTNLNVASWFGNYELDVLVESQEFGRQMQEMFIRDLSNSTEIVLADTARRTRRERKLAGPKQQRPRRNGKNRGSVRKATAGALNAATTLSAAITNKSKLGAAESRVLFIVGIGLLLIALAFIFFPRAASIPLILLLLLLAIPTIIKGIQNYRTN